MKTLAMGLAGAALLTTAAFRPRPAPPEPGLYFFFSPETPGLAELSRDLAASGLPVRRVLLASGFRDWPDEFETALPHLAPLSMVDEEGLALARRFAIRRTPCAVLVGAQGTHIACGTRIDWKELTQCSHAR